VTEVLLSQSSIYVANRAA